MHLNSLKKLLHNYYLTFAIILSFLFNITIEICARLSFVSGIKYIMDHPFLFLYNVCIILFTYAIALLFKKRAFSMLLVSCIWIAYTITNSVLMHFRNAPLIASDFLILKSALAVMHLYLTKFQVIAILSALIVAIVSLVFLAVKEISKKTNYKKVLILLITMITVTVIPTNYINAEKSKKTNSNITDEAFEYGFACCFIHSIFNNGITQPELYNKKNINSILEKIQNDNEPELKPNIIVLQLESFIDPHKLPGAEFTKDPVPNFRKLKDNCTSGKLNVAVYGGGTANTEFEVLTGMNIRHFGIGEYPYETILQDTAFESVCYNLKETGYSTHAIHNHTGTFYDRNIAYKNLGFDTFTPVEYMDNIEYNKLGWEKSTVFTESIFDTMSSTDNQDFIFAVTSQCHGKYPKEFELTSEDQIGVSGPAYIMDIKPELDYFCNELHDEDAWLGSFISSLENYDEPTMVIMYGDHMPSLTIDENILGKDSMYQTEYAIWTNYENEKNDRDIYTYHLLSMALDSVGIHNGIITKFHQYELNNNLKLYHELHLIQYDMLYGDHIVYNYAKQLPYLSTDMKFGIKDIKIDNIILNGETITVKGEGFNKFSAITIDNNIQKTELIDSQTLKTRKKLSKGKTDITVSQVSSDTEIIGSTKPYTINK